MLWELAALFGINRVAKQLDQQQKLYEKQLRRDEQLLQDAYDQGYDDAMDGMDCEDYDDAYDQGYQDALDDMGMDYGEDY